MQWTTSQTFSKRGKADLTVLPYQKGKKQAEKAHGESFLDSEIKRILATDDFSGKNGEVLFLYPEKGSEKRVALLGLGEKKDLSVEELRRAYASLCKAARSKKVESVNFLLPELKDLDSKEIVRGIVDGISLSNYAFDQLKHDTVKEKPTILLKNGTLIGAGKTELSHAKTIAAVFEGVYLARDLANGNADDVNPQFLAKTANELAKKYKSVKATVFDKKRIEKEKMGLLLAVNRGSSSDPAFIILEYKGNPKSKDVTVVVGKGITYDTGGLNLKPTGYMETMKSDMSGSACALGTILAAAASGIKQNVTAIVPSTENSISGSSYKPGDVYTSYAGKTVEIGNTDAEGRLVLADALAYASKKIKPSRIVDFATLTGAIVIALGEEATGLMSNDDQLAGKLTEAGKETFERVWRLPLYEEYKKQLKSDIADISNVGGREGGSITAGIFLQEFVGKDIPWAHCDIAGTAFLSKEKRYNPKFATGVGVRLMLEFLQNLK